MVNTLAHELRTPVSVLRMHLELLAEDPLDVPPATSLAVMDRSARRMEELIEDLMALATVNASESPLPPDPVDLSALTREACDFVGAVATGAGLDLVANVVDDLVVTGDEEGLRRVVANLVSNALKYTPPGGRVTVSLEPRSLADRKGVELVCADDGIGIDIAEVDHVFTPFFRSSSTLARERPGTGLGLAITRGVVERHQGSIDVRSEIGRGTTFTVWLPLAAQSDVG
jgi:signal transduction histidine kinase